MDIVAMRQGKQLSMEQRNYIEDEPPKSLLYSWVEGSISFLNWAHFSYKIYQVNHVNCHHSLLQVMDFQQLREVLHQKGLANVCSNQRHMFMDFKGHLESKTIYVTTVDVADFATR